MKIFDLQKAELLTKEKNRAAAVAMNAEIRRTKARLSEEVPKLQRLAVKRVSFLTLLLVISVAWLRLYDCFEGFNFFRLGNNLYIVRLRALQPKSLLREMIWCSLFQPGLKPYLMGQQVALKALVLGLPPQQHLVLISNLIQVIQMK